MIVSLKDTEPLAESRDFKMGLVVPAARMRAGAPNFGAPACSIGSTYVNTSGFIPPSNLTLVLPHTLLDRKRFKGVRTA